MGNIVEYNSPVDALHPNEVGSTAYEQLGRHVSADFNEAGRFIGGGIESLGHELEQNDARAENTQLYQDMSNTTISAHQALQDAIAKAPYEDLLKHDFLERFNSDTLAPMFDKLREKYTNPLVQARFEEEVARTTQSVMDRGIGMRSELIGRTAQANDKIFGDQQANLARTDPTLVPSLAEQSDRYVDTNVHAGAYPEAMGPSEKARRRANIYDSAGDGILKNIANNPHVQPGDIDKVISIVSDPKNGYPTNMSREGYDRLLDGLEKMKTQAIGVNTQIAAQTLPQLIASIQDTASPEHQKQAQGIIDSYIGRTQRETDLFKAKWQRNLDNAVGVGKEVADVKDMPDDQIKQRLNDLHAQEATSGIDEVGGIRTSQKLIHEAMVRRDEAFKKDGAQYSIDNNQSVQGAYHTFQEKPSPATFSAYATAQTAYQKRIYPNSVPTIVTADMKANIAGSLSKITQTPEGAAQAGQTLSSWQQTAGSYWPQMAHELYHDKILTPSQFVAGMLYGKPEARSTAEDVLRAASIPNKDLIANSGSTESKARAAADQALAPLANTLSNASNGHELMNAYEHALTDVLLYKGSVTSSDAGRLASKMIMDEYDFRGSMRIPKGLGVDADKVNMGAKSVLGVIDSHDLVAPQAMGSGLGPQDQAKAYARNVKAYGHWVTSEDEKSAILYDEQNHPVFENRMGKQVPVQLKWKDLNDLGEQQLSGVDKAFRFMLGEQT